MANDLLISSGAKRPKRGKADARARRRKAAETRQAEYSKLTTAQKLARPGLGAKERAKLLAKQVQK